MLVQPAGERGGEAGCPGQSCHLSVEHSLDGSVALVAGLLPLDQLRGALDEDVDQVDFALTDAVGVRDIPRAAGVGGVNTASTAGLELHLAEELLEGRTRGDLGELHHGPPM